MKGGSLASGSLAESSRASPTRHNQEAPRGNKICHQKTIERTYRVHRLRMDSCASTTDFSKEPRSFEFLDAKISKNFKAQFESQKVAKANQQLLAKLSAIQDEPVSRRLAKDAETRPKGPQVTHFKEMVRQRAAQKITRENEKILKRLKMLKPNYSAKKLAAARRREEKVLWLRQTDHTAGHLMKAPAPRPKTTAASATVASYVSPRGASFDESRRRRGCDVAGSVETGRGDAAGAACIVRGDDERARAYALSREVNG